MGFLERQKPHQPKCGAAKSLGWAEMLSPALVFSVPVTRMETVAGSFTGTLEEHLLPRQTVP